MYGNGKYYIDYYKHGQIIKSFDGHDYPDGDLPGQKSAEAKLFHEVLTGPGKPLSNIVRIYSGAFNLFAVDKNGHVWGWGSNQSYIVDYNCGADPDQVLGKAKDPVVEYAKDVTGMWSAAGLKVDIKNLRIAVGELSHILVIDKDGKLWSWGRSLSEEDINITHTDYRLGYDPGDKNAFSVMGEPRLAFLVSAGNIDSMVSNYTAAKRKRSDDAYSAGGKGGKRPDRALTVYTKAIKARYPSVPVLAGGLEASLRRFATMITGMIRSIHPFWLKAEWTF
jgi:hypothetical protein